MTTPLFREGDKVSLLVSAFGENDGGEEIHLPPGTPGKVFGVRKVSGPITNQGEYLYDVEFNSPWGVVWLIYDATDAHDLKRVED